MAELRARAVAAARVPPVDRRSTLHSCCKLINELMLNLDVSPRTGVSFEQIVKCYFVVGTRLLKF